LIGGLLEPRGPLVEPLDGLIEPLDGLIEPRKALVDPPDGASELVEAFAEQPGLAGWRGFWWRVPDEHAFSLLAYGEAFTPELVERVADDGVGHVIHLAELGHGRQLAAGGERPARDLLAEVCGHLKIRGDSGHRSHRDPSPTSAGPPNLTH
jgi:hypothetical protein